MPRETRRHVLYPSVNSNCSYRPEILKSRSNWHFGGAVWPWMWSMTLKNNREPKTCPGKLSVTFCTNSSMQTEVIIWKRFSEGPFDLEIWSMILKNDREPKTCPMKLGQMFRTHPSIQTAVIIWKWSEIAKIRLNRWFWPMWPWILTDDLENI